jgi:hypothetical protein
MALGTPKVMQVRDFRSQAEAMAWVSSLGAVYRKPDDVTKAPLYKTAAGVVLRLASPTRVEVLSNCVC